MPVGAVFEHAGALLAYGQDASSWTAGKINMWIGAILAILAILGGWKIWTGEEPQPKKIQNTAYLGVGLLILGVVVLFFVNNHFQGLANTGVNSIN